MEENSRPPESRFSNFDVGAAKKVLDGLRRKHEELKLFLKLGIEGNDLALSQILQQIETEIKDAKDPLLEKDYSKFVAHTNLVKNSLTRAIEVVAKRNKWWESINIFSESTSLNQTH